MMKVVEHEQLGKHDRLFIIHCLSKIEQQTSSPIFALPFQRSISTYFVHLNRLVKSRC